MYIIEKITMLDINKIYAMNCIEGMKLMDDNSVNLVITSPPYNVGIWYDVYRDYMSFDKYLEWTEEYLTQILRVLKPDGRIAINIPHEINIHDRGGRIFFSSEIWQIMKKVGFKWFGMVDLFEDHPHRTKLTAWGSYGKASSPYIHNPSECIILGFKENHIRKDKSNQFSFDVTTEEGRKDFKRLVFGRWKYMAETRTLGNTKANFSISLPMDALKILSYPNDVVLDPFMGAGTTACACVLLDRNYIGFDLSDDYVKYANERIEDFKKSKTHYLELIANGEMIKIIKTEKVKKLTKEDKLRIISENTDK